MLLGKSLNKDTGIYARYTAFHRIMTVGMKIAGVLQHVYCIGICFFLFIGSVFCLCRKISLPWYLQNLKTIAYL